MKTVWIRLVSVVGCLLAAMTLQAPGPARAAGPQLAPVMVVLDASGSMAEAVPGSGTRMDVAKRAVQALVEAAPETARMGMAIYGTGTGNSEADKAAGCRDVRIVQPVGAIDKGALVRAVNDATPRGYTPIGESLRVAAAALPKEGPRSVVLVSDGEDTCAPPDPCDVARELASQGVELRVHTIGYQVSGSARSQLTCVAQATGGTYHDASDAPALRDELSRVTVAAMRNYQPAGTPVTGTTTRTGAPLLKAGNYLDMLPMPGKRYYSFDLAAADATTHETAYIAATVPMPSGGGIRAQGLGLNLYGPDGADCGQHVHDFDILGGDREPITQIITWDGAAMRRSSTCSKPGRYTVAVELTISGSSDGEKANSERLPVEIQVGLEPPVVDQGLPAAEQYGSLTSAPGPDVPVTGGGSFGTAATLSDSGRYVEQMRVGEFLYYRVKLDWGQALAYRVNFPSRRYDGSSVGEVASRLYNPARALITKDSATYTTSPQHLPSSGYHGAQYFSTLPIRWQNRNLKGAEQSRDGLAGYYYIAVKLAAVNGVPDNAKDVAVPVTIELSITGTPEPGPRYATQSPERAHDTFGTDTRSVGPAAERKPETSRDGSVWLIAALSAAAGGVIVAAGAVLLVSRRRRR